MTGDARQRGAPFLDLTRENGALEDELVDAFRRVLRSGKYILGEEVESFERECAEYLGVRHAVGVSSGTDALLVSLMALRVGPGDEVICPAYGFVATPSVVVRLGAKPVFVDVLPCCYNLDPGAVARHVSSRTKCILPVHLFGQCAHMTELLQIAERHGTPLIEDAAQAMGATCVGRRAGSMGLAGCFSFFPSKNLGGLGDGGLVCTGSDDLARKLRRLRAHGATEPHLHQEIGGNFRLDALQAALLRVKLRRLDEALARRRGIAESYRTALAGVPGVVCPAACDEGHTYNQFVVRFEEGTRRDAMRAGLEERAIGAAIYYPRPLPGQRCFASGVGDRFEIAEQSAARTLALPIFPTMATGEIARVVEAIKAIVVEAL